MNPLKIAVRMFTTIVSEPMIVINDALKTTVVGLTGNKETCFKSYYIKALMLQSFKELISPIGCQAPKANL